MILPIYEVKTVPGKGRGLFARSDIPEGARILVENPLLTVPLLHPSWNKNLNMMTIHAICSIKAGEEITISYTDAVTIQERQDYLKENFGFKCSCELCSLSPAKRMLSDRRRIEIDRLNHVVFADYNQEKNLPNLYKITQLLEEVNNQSKIFEYKRAARAPASEIYYTAARVAVSNGDQARASIFGERAYRERVICTGEDGEDVQDMERLMNYPASHKHFSLSKGWKSLKDDFPKGLNKEQFEKWLWLLPRDALSCDRCRAKKLKCSKDIPICTSCAHSASQCHYSGKVARSPLTRAYLTGVEKRLHSLESLVTQLVPGVDIDSLLATPSLVSKSPPKIPPRSPEIALSPEGSTKSNITEPALPEAVPNSVDGFNWHEENVNVHGLTDGMAALSVEPTGVGYLGLTSGVVFLRCLLDWAGFLHQSVVPPQLHVPQPSTSFRNVLASSHISHAALANQLSADLVNAYFSNFHVVYPFVHEATFRAQYHDVIPRPSKRSWNMLYHAIIALGAWTLNNDHVGLEDYLYRRALTLGQEDSVFEAASLTSVQALVLLSNLSQKRNSPNTGWNLLGLAVRTALSLALHRELPHWNISLLEREVRRRVWWGVYIFDSGASMTFGRAVMLPDRDSMNVHCVLNITDESLTPEMTQIPPEAEEPTIYSQLRAQSSFHIHTNYISNRLLAEPGLSAEAALALNTSMDAWTPTVPPYFQLSHTSHLTTRWYAFARSRLWWRFWNLKIIVFRQILLRWAISERGQIPDQGTQSAQEDCKRICLDAAHSTVISIHQYAMHDLSRLEGWYATFFLFHAALVLTLCIISFPRSEETATWSDDVRMAKTTFRERLVGDSLAARCVAILDQVVSNDDMTSGLLQDLELDKDALSSFPWSVESSELFNSFDWDLNGNGF
ncbi:lactose regulatory LAC9 [Pyrenophora seminiperda CCB06]|uniref:Lactose regulatory LAC9 n=1 Tax=Pyrenophora seminiperda CCB06 TaxID=1302712 RepID=A0A3M7M9H4_9PLEO|nr:lactose regulatory LAC9 [Pyrenophora seminiperda CCB06]